mgnify:CR=1 FL=1
MFVSGTARYYEEARLTVQLVFLEINNFNGTARLWWQVSQQRVL